MNQNAITLVRTAITKELEVNDSNELVIEELYNNELLAGLAVETIDMIVHKLSDAGEVELI